MTDTAQERAGPERAWLRRLLGRERRRAPRRPAANLAAYYFDGASPRTHGIRDISAKGLFLITGERWYPGTLVMVVLQRENCAIESAGRAVVVQSRAVRWGEDGVGMEFIFPSKDSKPENLPPMEAGSQNTVGRKALERFLAEAAG